MKLSKGSEICKAEHVFRLVMYGELIDLTSQHHFAGSNTSDSSPDEDRRQVARFDVATAAGLAGFSRVLYPTTPNATVSNLVFFRDAAQPSVFTGLYVPQEAHYEALETQWRLGVVESYEWQDLLEGLRSKFTERQLPIVGEPRIDVEIEWRLPNGSVLSNLPPTFLATPLIQPLLGHTSLTLKVSATVFLLSFHQQCRALSYLACPDVQRLHLEVCCFPVSKELVWRPRCTAKCGSGGEKICSSFHPPRLNVCGLVLGYGNTYTSIAGSEACITDDGYKFRPLVASMRVV